MKKNIVKIDSKMCKGCELCVIECPQHIIKMSNEMNSLGYFPAEIIDMSKCTGCKFCAISCPEAIIEVYREED